MPVCVPGGGNKGGAFVFAWPGETVVVKTGLSATAVRVGNGANEGATGEKGVLNCSSNEVLVADGKAGRVDVEPGTFV